MRSLVAALGLAPVLVACATTVSNADYTAASDAPLLERRPDGCHVEIYEEGKDVPVKHQVIGHVVLEKGKADLRGGPDSGYGSLRAVACEHGAFIVRDVRALPTANGFVFEGDLAVLLDEQGRPVGNTPAPATTDGGAAP